MIPPVVVDSSVAYKWLCPCDEGALSEAHALLARHRAGDIALVAPQTLHVELANALRCSKWLEPHDALALIAELDAFRIQLAETDSRALERATEIAYAWSISVYDALFLGLAEELGCPLVTADRKAFAKVSMPIEIRLI